MVLSDGFDKTEVGCQGQTSLVHEGQILHGRNGLKALSCVCSGAGFHRSRFSPPHTIVTFRAGKTVLGNNGKFPVTDSGMPSN